jgi:hypothetical protein
VVLSEFFETDSCTIIRDCLPLLARPDYLTKYGMLEHLADYLSHKKKGAKRRSSE